MSSRAAKYRDGDFEIDSNLGRTTSWPDGLDEEYRFLPHFQPVARRSSSRDDLSKYDRYFDLAKSNRGGHFTWRQYSRILMDDLRNFDSYVILSKLLLRHNIASPLGSEVSNYFTASDTEPSNKTKTTKWSLKRNESISSMDTCSTLSLTPQTSALRAMCNKIGFLARNCSKTVEKLCTKTKRCEQCVERYGSEKAHKKHSRLCGDGSKHLKSLRASGNESDTMSDTERVRVRSLTIDIQPPKKQQSTMGEFGDEARCSQSLEFFPTVEVRKKMLAVRKRAKRLA